MIKKFCTYQAYLSDKENPLKRIVESTKIVNRDGTIELKKAI